MKVKILVAIAVIIAGLFLFAELALRLLFGLGNPPLYLADGEIGYLLAPNQNVRRSGNRFIINEYSMRSPKFSPERPQETLRIFLLGDSVANGAWWTDQNRVISTLMQQQLAVTGKTVEVLNASANSWSPRNQLAYLRRYGVFSSQVVILLINTDDLFGTAPTSLPVGNSLYYPEKKPPLALVELYNRYFVGEKPIPGMKEVQAESGDRVGFNLEAIEEIKQICTANNSQFILAMTPLLREIGEPGSRDYEQKARQRLQEFVSAQEIYYLDFLPIFEANSQSDNLYRDHIHLSDQGDKLVSEKLNESVKSVVIDDSSEGK